MPFNFNPCFFWSSETLIWLVLILLPLQMVTLLKTPLQSKSQYIIQFISLKYTSIINEILTKKLLVYLAEILVLLCFLYLIWQPWLNVNSISTTYYLVNLGMLFKTLYLTYLTDAWRIINAFIYMDFQQLDEWSVRRILGIMISIYWMLYNLLNIISNLLRNVKY